MLSDEEKKAIKIMKEVKDKNVHTFVAELSIVLNLIEKQSKEIEEAEQKEKKAYIDGTNVAHELCNKKWEDKIKEKVIKIKNKPVKDKFITASQGKLDTIIEIESLLERK